jgi:hypothetical protein
VQVICLAGQFAMTQDRERFTRLETVRPALLAEPRRPLATVAADVAPPAHRIIDIQPPAVE